MKLNKFDLMENRKLSLEESETGKLVFILNICIIGVEKNLSMLDYLSKEK